MTCLETLPPPPLAESCIVVIETKRLILRAPQLVDVKAIAALANDRRIAENTEPLSTRTIPSGEPVLSVLEINGGVSKQLGIKAGDKVEHKLFKR